MRQNLRGRSFLKLLDFSADEIRHLLKLATVLKEAKVGGDESPMLIGKNIALIFERDSLLRRSGYENAAHDLGARVTHLGPSGSTTECNGSMKDTALVLGRFYDGIEYCGFCQHDADLLEEYSGVPVFNGRTQDFHPMQFLADLMTMREVTHKPLCEVVVCFMGDVGGATAASLMVGAALIGMDLRLCGPRSCWPDAALFGQCRAIAKISGARITQTEVQADALDGADFVYTDAWITLDAPDNVWKERIALLSPYQVTRAVMEKTGNPDCRFLHCLPARHARASSAGETTFPKLGVDYLEVTDEVFDSRASVVVEQAENRMHAIKAVLVATLGP